MGFLRKATWVATGGASGLVVKANSKKERTAKALEQQNRLMKEQLKLQRQLAQGAAPARVIQGAEPSVWGAQTLKEKRAARHARQQRTLSGRIQAQAKELQAKAQAAAAAQPVGATTSAPPQAPQPQPRQGDAPRVAAYAAEAELRYARRGLENAKAGRVAGDQATAIEAAQRRLDELTSKQSPALPHQVLAYGGFGPSQPAASPSPRESLWSAPPHTSNAPTMPTVTIPSGMSQEAATAWQSVSNTQRNVAERIPQNGLATTLRVESVLPVLESMKLFVAALPDAQALRGQSAGRDVASLQRQVVVLANLVTTFINAGKEVTKASSKLVTDLILEGKALN